MGRKQSPIEDAGPVGDFARYLVAFKGRDPSLTYRTMGKKANFSDSQLSAAARGKQLPTQAAAEAFLRGCGASDEELAEGLQRWRQAQQEMIGVRRKLGEPEVVLAPGAVNSARRIGKLRPVKPNLADPHAHIPSPETVQTFGDLQYQLRVVRIRVGSPAYRVLAQRSGRADLRTAEMGSLPVLSKSAIAGILAGGRVPTYDQFRTLMYALLSSGEQGDRVEPWCGFGSWKLAWHRAEFNRTRPDLQRRGYGNVVLLTGEQDNQPTAAVLSEMDVDVAAALLAAMPPKTAAAILSSVAPDKATTLILKMHTLTGNAPEPEGVSIEDAGTSDAPAPGGHGSAAG
ncbi:helix-turn-helix domain-containing protein [Amycolatopsis sp. 195334CR]|uniref:helix-turn-helix domain-containing protein n=1 Tax=Amycolatopsis sp. 195334CR TaxID=2814588 RepID=UPI001A8DE60E|nr:helix-turn-helix domain-containing protein [Amycolatopsis sp. 195334CR]MBN6040033.1 helix-turn-helix domain-containing protein [Amycolatopsis sp. 195334CR]